MNRHSDSVDPADEIRPARYEDACRYTMDLPAVSKALVLAPHPDDETLGCGGTIVRHRECGHDVECLFLTQGETVACEVADVRAARRAEAEAAAQVLGLRRIEFLNYPDMGLIAHIPEARSRVLNAVLRFGPGIVYAPSPMEFHPDHRAAARIALFLLTQGVPVAFYEIYAPSRFNRLIDISAVLPAKEKAMGCYRVSLLGAPERFARTMGGLARYRAFLAPPDRPPRAWEAFWLVDRPLRREDIVGWLTYGL